MASSLPPRYQTLQLDTSSTSVRVKESANGEPFVLLEDIRDAFCQVVSAFELNGEPVPFLENKDRDPYVCACLLFMVFVYLNLPLNLFCCCYCLFFGMPVLQIVPTANCVLSWSDLDRRTFAERQG